MNDYISKPVNPQELMKKIEQRALKGNSGSANGDDNQKPDPADTDHRYGSRPFDVKSALARAMGDQAFLKELVTEFVKTLPSHLAAIDGAMTRQDNEALSRAAHTLKGAAANLSMGPLAEVAKAIEHNVRDQNWAGAATEIARLHHESERVAQYTANMAW
jgi:HPt (histidine-containing phosphotransfer) domain-containing protein